MKQADKLNNPKLIYLGYFIFYLIVIIGVAKCTEDHTKRNGEESWLGTGGNYAE